MERELIPARVTRFEIVLHAIWMERERDSMSRWVGSAMTTLLRYLLRVMRLDFLEDDELLEITPDSLRLRKRVLLALDRKRANKK